VPGARSRGRAPISCTIICYDEEENIRAALESVKWCDEIVVVDSFSHDRTVAICREYTERIHQRPWPGFVEQKAFALEQARFPWVLNLDADERVSPELRRELEQVLRAPEADGYYVPRLVYYLGRWWRRGGWYPDYRLRLFRRDRVVWGGVDPHEKVILHGRSARLHGPLLHYTYRDISDHVATINAFTGVAAREFLLRGRTSGIGDLLLRPLWRFVRFYVLRLGFTQGLAGLFVAQSAAFYVFTKYAKLWEATQEPRAADMPPDAAGADVPGPAAAARVPTHAGRDAPR
jgi:glycosyltransferase involved in cell wall biosynthesis